MSAWTLVQGIKCFAIGLLAIGILLYGLFVNDLAGAYRGTSWVVQLIGAVVLLFGCAVIGFLGFFLARIFLSGLIVATAVVIQSGATGTVTISGLPALAVAFGDITVSVIAAAIVALLITLSRRAKAAGRAVESGRTASSDRGQESDRPVKPARPVKPVKPPKVVRPRSTTGRSVIVSPGEPPRIVLHLPASDSSSRLVPVAVAQLGRSLPQGGATASGENGLPVDWLGERDPDAIAGWLGRALQSDMDSADARPFLQQVAKALPNINELVLTGLGMYDRLTTAAQDTLANPGTTEQVSLPEVKLSTNFQRQVTFLDRGSVTGTALVDVGVGLKTDNAVARVTNGRLVGFEAPQAALAIDLSVGGFSLPSIEVPYDVGARLPLGEGIPLTRTAGHPA